MSRRIQGSKNIILDSSPTVGTTASKVLEANKARLAYRIYASSQNNDNIYHGHDSRIGTTGLVYILPGGMLEDEGESAYQGEVWLISGTATQAVYIEEIVKQ